MGKFWASTLPHKMCPRKQTTERQYFIADLGIIFLRRSYLIHWYQLLHPHIVGSIPIRFFWATLYSFDSQIWTCMVLMYNSYTKYSLVMMCLRQAWFPHRRGRWSRGRIPSPHPLQEVPCPEPGQFCNLFSSFGFISVRLLYRGHTFT